MKILVFTEGTVLMHAMGVGLTREQVVEQVKKKDNRIFNYKTHLPVGNAVNKILAWKNQGAEIYYLTSRKTPVEVQQIRTVLKKYRFPGNENLLFRKEGEEYKDVVERLMPDILIEDDCESIGGKNEMTYTHIREDLKSKIKSIVVKEFGGIDHLPDDLGKLVMV